MSVAVAEAFPKMTPAPPLYLKVHSPKFADKRDQAQFVKSVRTISAIFSCDIKGPNMIFSLRSGFTKHSAEKIAMLFSGYQLDQKPLHELFTVRFGRQRDWPEIRARLKAIFEGR